MEIDFLNRFNYRENFPHVEISFAGFAFGLGISVRKGCTNEELLACINCARKEMDELFGMQLDISIWIQTFMDYKERYLALQNIKGIETLYAFNFYTFLPHELDSFECNHIYINGKCNYLSSDLENMKTLNKITIQLQNVEKEVYRDKCKAGEFIKKANGILKQMKDKMNKQIEN